MVGAAELSACAGILRLVENALLEREGLLATACPQQDSRAIPASRALHDAIINGRLVLPDDRVLAAHAPSAIAQHSRRGWHPQAALPPADRRRDRAHDGARHAAEPPGARRTHRLDLTCAT